MKRAARRAWISNGVCNPADVLRIEPLHPGNAVANDYRHDRASTQRRGALIGVAGSPIQVRNPDAKGVETEPMPFMSSALPIAGFAVIEATDLAEAIDLVSGSPCAVAHGVVEVWPLQEV